MSMLIVMFFSSLSRFVWASCSSFFKQKKDLIDERSDYGFFRLQECVDFCYTLHMHLCFAFFLENATTNQKLYTNVNKYK